MELLLPPPVERALGMLEESGYAAYVVGGCVRDRLLGREPNDWDIATDALPEQMTEVFSGAARILPTGLQHGTLTLLLDGWQLEATTFRIDGRYTDGRRPDHVSFTGEIGRDLARRDYTINAMAYSPRHGFADPFGGREDLEQRRLRCVGAPAARFSEDALRILRGLRFFSQLGFPPEEETAKALFDCRGLLKRVSAERLAAETGKLICGAHARQVLLSYRPVLEVFLPELTRLEQNGGWAPSVRAACRLPPSPVLRWAALLHSCGEAPEASARRADGLLRRLRYDNRTREAAVFLIENQAAPVPAQAAAIRHWLYRAGEERLRQLLCLKQAVCLEEKEGVGLQELEEAQQLVDAALEEGMPFSLKDLTLSGRDLLELGIPAGPQVGRLLRLLLRQVLDGSCENSREALRERAEKQARSLGLLRGSE